MIVPATWAEAIDQLVELDVKKWGEGERTASREMHLRNHPTYGLALNSLAHRPEYDFGSAAAELVAAAKKALTSDDRDRLRDGG